MIMIIHTRTTNLYKKFNDGSSLSSPREQKCDYFKGVYYSNRANEFVLKYE